MESLARSSFKFSENDDKLGDDTRGKSGVGVSDSDDI